MAFNQPIDAMKRAAEQAAYETRLQQEGERKVSSEQLQKAEGVIAVAILQQLANRYAANELAAKVRKMAGFAELLEGLTADFVQQTVGKSLEEGQAAIKRLEPDQLIALLNHGISVSTATSAAWEALKKEVGIEFFN